MNYVYTVLGTTGAIILAELLGGYGLGDFVKDGYERLFGASKSFAQAQASRLKVSLAKAVARL